MPRPSYDTTIDAVYRAASDPGTWPAALEALADHVGGSGCLISYQNLQTNEGFLITGRLREDLGDLYVREYCRNPIALAIAAKGQPGKSVVASTLVDERAVRRTAFHADILDPQRIVDFVVLPHRAFTQGRSTGGIAVTLTRAQADRAGQGPERMARLAPHLSRALDLSLEVARHRDEARRLGSLLHALPTAAMLLDRAGRIVRANSQAETFLAANDGLCTRPGALLAASLPGDERPLREVLWRAASVASGEEGGFQEALRVHRPSGLAPCLLIVTPLPRAALALWEMVEPGPSVLVQVIHTQPKLDTQALMLREACHLTEAEARVAALIGSGLTAPQAAAILGLSPNTVRTHLKRCFDKTGARSQTALASLLATISGARGA